MDALILAGGLGTRLRNVVSDRAKPVAEIGGQPFLAFMLRRLEKLTLSPTLGGQGASGVELRTVPGGGRTSVRRVILCVGHQADSVRRALGDRFGRVELVYSFEDRPLGTGGALRHALLSHKVAAPALALNGDTWFPIRFDRLVARHRANDAIATLALARVPDVARYGAVKVRGNLVIGFEEKGRHGPGLVNGGIYALGAPALKRLANAPEVFSLERDMLPAWCAERRLGAYPSRARFIDIGLPEDYARAAALVG
jgi:D-glycero-alpha-D-manno-heptose 1-phosphate guanylyltransferase